MENCPINKKQIAKQYSDVPWKNTIYRHSFYGIPLHHSELRQHNQTLQFQKHFPLFFYDENKMNSSQDDRGCLVSETSDYVYNSNDKDPCKRKDQT